MLEAVPGAEAAGIHCLVRTRNHIKRHLLQQDWMTLRERVSSRPRRTQERH
jgi:hypothetical protein